MSSQAALGTKALNASHYDEAVKHFTLALADTKSPTWFIQRSTAHQRLGQYELALADAEDAVLTATARARRELIAQGQFRRALALHGLKRYGDARLCLAWARKLDEKMKALGMWQARVVKDYEDAGGDGALENSTTVTELPIPNSAEAIYPIPTKIGGKHETVEEQAHSKETSSRMSIASTTARDKIRHEFFQSNDKLTVLVFAKGIPREHSEIIINQESLRISFPILHSAEGYSLSIDPLFSPIEPAHSSFQITPHKIEISLQKASPGLKWSSLQKHTSKLASSFAQAIPSATNINIPSNPISEKSPVYPTSSRYGPKDWDLVASYALQHNAVAVADATRGINDDDSDSGDPASNFFKKLYKGADADTRRAMMKSYQESNGTSLSTNWDEVRKETVKTRPPDGVEAKRWEN